MKLQITARHYNASPQLHANVGEEVEKLKRFNESITSAHVILEADGKGMHRAELVMHVSEKNIHAHAEDAHMGKAIELMMDKATRQLKKENEKHKGHKSLPLSELAPAIGADAEAVVD